MFNSPGNLPGEARGTHNISNGSSGKAQIDPSVRVPYAVESLGECATQSIRHVSVFEQYHTIETEILRSAVVFLGD